jgi:hypothetical protein
MLTVNTAPHIAQDKSIICTAGGTQKSHQNTPKHQKTSTPLCTLFKRKKKILVISCLLLVVTSL